MATVNEIIVANQGTFNVNDTTEVTKNFDGIFVLEDTIFTSIKVGGVDVKSTYIQTPASLIKAGSLIRPIDAGVFSGLQLTSGSVIIIL